MKLTLKGLDSRIKKLEKGEEFHLSAMEAIMKPMLKTSGTVNSTIPGNRCQNCLVASDYKNCAPEDCECSCHGKPKPQEDIRQEVRKETIQALKKWTKGRNVTKDSLRNYCNTVLREKEKV